MKINICLAPLTEKQKKIYRLYKKGMRIGEIAEKLKVNGGYVSRTLKICIDKLYKFYYNLARYRKLARSASLTPRERDVFRRWKIYGRTAEQVGKDLGLSKRTICNYKNKIRGKIDVRELEYATRANDTFNESRSFESFDYELDPF